MWTSGYDGLIRVQFNDRVTTPPPPQADGVDFFLHRLGAVSSAGGAEHIHRELVQAGDLNRRQLEFNLTIRSGQSLVVSVGPNGNNFGDGGETELLVERCPTS